MALARALEASVPASEEWDEGVATRDVAIDAQLGVWARLFRPQSAAAAPPAVVLYFHGGAYCLGQPSSPPFHAFCRRMAARSGAIWLSVAYRLAPAHRLPAAYHDAAAALRWLHAPSDPWLRAADFSTCFLAGDSAGATIAFHLALNSASSPLPCLRILGLLLVHPGFHSEASKASMLDAHLADLPTDRLYQLALPPGQTLDSFPINPLSPLAPSLSPLAAFPNIFVAVADQDFRYGLALRFHDAVQGLSPNVQLFVTQGKGHVFHLFDPDCKEAADLENRLADFIRASVADFVRASG